jgi:segregation and condensation protein A
LAEPRSDGYKTELEGVRAPLGVILYLIRRDNLDIYDIPVARIMREYLEYLDVMESMNIELAGEFFVLAATLMRIKAQMLLRRGDDTEEDPRTELVRSLIEYKKMVEAARKFKDLEEERRSIFTRPVPEVEKAYREEPVIDLSLYHLMKTFQEIMHEFEASDVSEIHLEEFTIEEKIIAVIEALRQNRQVEFRDLFSADSSRLELIVTLIALLELIKHTQVKINQDKAFGSIWLYRGENFGRPMGTPEDWDGATVPPAENAPFEATAADGDGETSDRPADGESGDENTVEDHG